MSTSEKYQEIYKRIENHNKLEFAKNYLNDINFLLSELNKITNENFSDINALGPEQQLNITQNKFNDLCKDIYNALRKAGFSVVPSAPTA